MSEIEANSIITLVNEYGTYSISTNAPAEHVDEFTETLIRPLMLAMGYHPDTVDEVFDAPKPVTQSVSVWDYSMKAPDPTWSTYTSFIPDKIGVGTRYVCTNTEDSYCDMGEVFMICVDEHEDDSRCLSLKSEKDSCVYADFIYVKDADDLTQKEIEELFAGHQRFFERLAV